MKNTITISAFFLVTSLNVFAQKPVPIVDYKGHILNGKTQMLLHENYKQQVACAVHCLYENKCMPASDMKHSY